eukprot:tig00000093_g3597.t1
MQQEAGVVAVRGAGAQAPELGPGSGYAWGGSVWSEGPHSRSSSVARVYPDDPLSSAGPASPASGPWPAGALSGRGRGPGRGRPPFWAQLRFRDAGEEDLFLAAYSADGRPRFRIAMLLSTLAAAVWAASSPDGTNLALRLAQLAVVAGFFASTYAPAVRRLPPRPYYAYLLACVAANMSFLCARRAAATESELYYDFQIAYIQMGALLYLHIPTRFAAPILPLLLAAAAAADFGHALRSGRRAEFVAAAALQSFNAVLGLLILAAGAWYELDVRRRFLLTRAAERDRGGAVERQRRSRALLESLLPGPVIAAVEGEDWARINRLHEDAAVLFVSAEAPAPAGGAEAEAGPRGALEAARRLMAALEGVAEARGVLKIKPRRGRGRGAGGRRQRGGGRRLRAGGARGGPRGGIPARAGLFSGALVSGVIGCRLAFDVFGDACNLAQRMCAHGEAGRVHLPASARDAILAAGAGAGLAFSEPSVTPLKGRGPWLTCFVSRAGAAAPEDLGGPPGRPPRGPVSVSGRSRAPSAAYLPSTALISRISAGYSQRRMSALSIAFRHEDEAAAAEEEEEEEEDGVLDPEAAAEAGAGGAPAPLQLPRRSRQYSFSARRRSAWGSLRVAPYPPGEGAAFEFAGLSAIAMEQLRAAAGRGSEEEAAVEERRSASRCSAARRPRGRGEARGACAPPRGAARGRNETDPPPPPPPLPARGLRGLRLRLRLAFADARAEGRFWRAARRANRAPLRALLAALVLHFALLPLLGYVANDFGEASSSRLPLRYGLRGALLLLALAPLALARGPLLEGPRAALLLHLLCGAACLPPAASFASLQGGLSLAAASLTDADACFAAIFACALGGLPLHHKLPWALLLVAAAAVPAPAAPSFDRALVPCWVASVAFAMLAVAFLREREARRGFLQRAEARAAAAAAARAAAESNALLELCLPRAVLRHLPGLGPGPAAAAAAGTVDFERVCVLQSDIVGFSALASRTDAPRLVDALNALFAACDEIAERYGVQTLRTVGDAWVGVVGLEGPAGPGEVANLLRAAHEMRAVHEWAHETLSARFGVGMGPAAGAVVGVRQWTWELLGPAVAEAAESERAAPPDRCLLPASAARLVAAAFDFEAGPAGGLLLLGPRAPGAPAPAPVLSAPALLQALDPGVED